MDKGKRFKLITLSLALISIFLGLYVLVCNKTDEKLYDSVHDPKIEETGSIPKEEVEIGTTGERIFSGEVLAGGSSPLIDFNEKDYQKAKDSGKTIFLYFYAKWCPTCKAEIRDSLIPAFNEYGGSDFVGFRVNYNDRDTDDIEKDLAEEFGILYQHTKVIISGGDVRVFPNVWTKSQYTEEFLNNIQI